MIALASNCKCPKSAIELQTQHTVAVQRRYPWQEIWKLICEHPWFHEKLEQSARKVIRLAYFNIDQLDDIKQQVVVELASALQRHPMLGFDSSKGSYTSFLSTIIYRNCLKSLRQFGKTRTWSYIEDVIHPTYEDQGQREKIIDFRHIASQIPAPYRKVVRQVCDGYSIEEIAKSCERSERTVYRMIEHSIELMQVIYFGDE